MIDPLKKIIIGTRGSQLALWQANWAKDTLTRLNPGLQVEIRTIKTKGDSIQDISLPALGEQGKGLFTRELELEMLQGRIHLAVHSLKDLPTEDPSGLQISAISEREDVRDALVTRAGIAGFDDLPAGARIGTSSLRRQAQVKARRPDLILETIRGNVDTRIRKLDEGGFDALILAAAGLRRLDRADRITQYLEADFMLPAVGQGALGIQTRAGDSRVIDLVAGLDHQPSHRFCVAERAFLHRLGGGCLVPIAALCRSVGNRLVLNGMVATPDGSRIMRGQGEGLLEEPERVGGNLAEEFLQRGAGRILRG